MNQIVSIAAQIAWYPLDHPGLIGVVGLVFMITGMTVLCRRAAARAGRS